MEILTLQSEIDSMDGILNSSNDIFKPRFFYGTKLDLNVFLKVNENDKKHLYPIIYLVTPYKTTGLDYKNAKMNFVLAVNNSKISMSNMQRMLDVFVPILIPLKKQFIDTLKYSKFIDILDENNIEEVKYFGYRITSEDYKTNFKAGLKYDINAHWDAISIDVELIFKNKC